MIYTVIAVVYTLISVAGMGALLDVLINPTTKTVRIPIIIAVSIIVLSDIMLYFLIYRLRKILKNNCELKLLQNKMTFDRKRYEESIILWDKIKTVRHDIKNHLTVILGYLKMEDPRSAEEYIDKIMPEIGIRGKFIQPSGSVIDYLINSKLSDLKDTKVVVSGRISSFDDIEDTDLASIMGNILDNAIEAENKLTEGKRIELLFTMKNDNRIIICKNAVSESVLTNNKDLRSTKKNSGEHGLGHRIVESVLKKYDGFVEYFEIDSMFGVQVMLPMPAKK